MLEVKRQEWTENGLRLDWHEPTQIRGLLLFMHGFKGYKDWGAWNLMARKFAQAGYVFAKLDLRGNGTTAASPKAFADLEAFGRSTYAQDLEDIDHALAFLQARFEGFAPVLIGHSKGGGLALVAASEHQEVKALISWASVGRMDWLYSPERLAILEQDGVFYIENARTKQQLPHYRSAYEAYESERGRFDLPKLALDFERPWLLVHGEDDAAVPSATASILGDLTPSAKVVILPKADHVFNTREPWLDSKLPAAAQRVVDESLAFLNALS